MKLILFRRASDFEFRWRFWLVAALFLAAFSMSRFDPVNAGEALLGWGARAGMPLRPGGTPGELQALYFVFATVVGAAAWLRTWGSAYVHSPTVHDRNLRSERLVADGPYRHVRNPLYLGNLLLSVGLGILASRLGFIVLFLGMWILTRRLIGREEAGFAASQGERFRAFRAAVPRLWPALRPRLAPSGMRPNWKQAVVGEVLMWGLTAAFFCYAATLNFEIFWIMVIAAVLLRFAAKVRVTPVLC